MATPTVLAPTRGMSHADWLGARRQGIGGSDIGPILGLTPQYRTAIDIWLEKTGRKTPDVPHPFTIGDIDYPSEAAYWGTVHEEAIADHFAATTGYKVFRKNAVLRHPEYAIMLANVDREVLIPGRGRGVLELKTASAWLKDDWADDRVPLAYQCQVQWYMSVGGYPYAFIAALIGGNRYTCTRIDRDEDVIATLIEAAQAFWRYVETDTMPPVDDSKVCSDLLGELHPQSDPEEEIELSPSFADLIAEYDDLKARGKELDARMTYIENLIKAEMADAERARIDDRTVVWKTIASNRVNTKLLKERHPDIAGEVTEAATSRRFEIKKAS